MESKTMFLSAAIIVKNEEKNILRCLNSIKPFVNQIVVVDTGSTDKTAQICIKFGAEVIFYTWTDSFANARNLALAHCRHNWIISIDADEEANFDSLDEYAEYMNDDKVGGINLKIKNIVSEGGNLATSHRYTRIFRNSKEIRYNGRIHEQIRESIENNGYDVIETDLEIIHYGYGANKEARVERNRTMLQKEMEENGQSGWQMYHLADTEFSSGNLQIAEKLFLQAIASNELSDEQNEKSLLRLSQIALSSDNLEEIPRLLEFESTDIEREGFRKYIMAAYQLQKHNFAEALELYNSEDLLQSSMVDQDKVAQAKVAINNLLNQ